MNSDQILYTDGREVVVTPSTFQVKDTFYKLKGITKHNLAVVKAKRIPGLISLMLGIIIMVAGYNHVIPDQLVPALKLFGRTIAANAIALWTGLVLVVGGLAGMAMVKERYAVRISTAEGDKNAVVSSHREYISQILGALNRAFMMLEPKKSLSTKLSTSK